MGIVITVLLPGHLSVLPKIYMYALPAGRVAGVYAH